MSNVTEKIQVLLTQDDMEQLNIILLMEALENNSKPESLSSYVRTIIRDYIKSYKHNEKLKNKILQK